MSKAKFLLSALVMCPTVANAAMVYRVEHTTRPVMQNEYGADNRAFARGHRFYVGGMYNFSMWDSFTDDNDLYLGGKNANSFEVVAGVRPYDIFRVELNYIHNDARWSDFSIKGETAMVNALFDARINSLYRLFYRQRLVPYVGAGGGAMWVRSDDADLGRKVVPAVAALAGIGAELGDWFTLDFGYRYFYSFSPKVDGVSGLNPSAHQFRVGVRVNF